MLVNTERFGRRLAEQGLDGVVAATLENVHYFTGISSMSLGLHPYFGQCYAVAALDGPEKPVLVASVGEADQLLDAFTGVERVATFGSFHRELRQGIDLTCQEQRLKSVSVDATPAANAVAALAEALRIAGLAGARVGLDDDGLRKGVREELAGHLPEATFTDASKDLAWIRRVKTADEIRRLRRAATAAGQAIRASVASAREGTTEYELMLEFNRAIVSQGASPRMAMIRIGRNGVGGQVRPDRTPLRKGDTIWFDVGCVNEGYWSDMARNVAFGEPKPRVRQLYQAVKQGEDEVIRLTRPGMSGADLFNLTVEAVRAAGISNYQRHHVGHGIGAEVYEQPILMPSSQVEIELGMVLNVETPYYEFGTGGIHVEDPFVVGAEGDNVLLSSVTRDLMIVEP